MRSPTRVAAAGRRTVWRVSCPLCPFVPPSTAAILPGQISVVLVISTNAIAFNLGNASVIDGETATVSAFQPTVATTPTPEPATMLLLGTGLAVVAGAVKRRRNRG